MKTKILIFLIVLVLFLTSFNSCKVIDNLINTLIKVTGNVILENEVIIAFKNFFANQDNFDLVIGLISETINDQTALLLKNFSDYMDFKVIENIIADTGKTVTYIIDKVNSGKYFLRVIADFNKNGKQDSNEPTTNWPAFNDHNDFKSDTTIPDVVLSTN